MVRAGGNISSFARTCVAAAARPDALLRAASKRPRLRRWRFCFLLVPYGPLVCSHGGVLRSFVIDPLTISI